MTQIGSDTGMYAMYAMYALYASAKNSIRPKTKRPGQIEIIHSRVRALCVHLAAPVHGVHGVQGVHDDRPKSQLTANGGETDRKPTSAAPTQRPHTAPTRIKCDEL